MGVNWGFNETHPHPPVLGGLPGAYRGGLLGVTPGGCFGGGVCPVKKGAYYI